MLAQSEAVQIPLHEGVAGPKNIPPISIFKPMTLDFGQAASRVEDVTARLALDSRPLINGEAARQPRADRRRGPRRVSRHRRDAARLHARGSRR